MQNKIQIPKKTKIAAWIMTIYGVSLFVLFGVAAIYLMPLLVSEIILTIYTLLVVAYYLTVGYLLFKGKRRAWNMSIAGLMVVVFGFFWSFLWLLSTGATETVDSIKLAIYLFGILVNIVPLCLLFVDRKNYFVMVVRAENTKKLNENI